MSLQISVVFKLLNKHLNKDIVQKTASTNTLNYLRRKLQRKIL